MKLNKEDYFLNNKEEKKKNLGFPNFFLTKFISF